MGALMAGYADRKYVCSACKRPIQVGQKVIWEIGTKNAYHPDCAPSKESSEPIALVGGGAQQPLRRNKYAGNCERCGVFLNPGEGIIYRCLEDSGCLRHHDRGGWHLYCADSEGCAKRYQERLERLRQAEEALRKQREEEERKRQEGQRKFQEFLERLREEGYVEISASPPDPIVIGKRGEEYLLPYGAQAFVQPVSFVDENQNPVTGYRILRISGVGDMVQESWAFPKDAALRVLRRAAARLQTEKNITPDKAKEYLEKYAPFHGDDLYKVIAGMDPFGDT